MLKNLHDLGGGARILHDYVLYVANRILNGLHQSLFKSAYLIEIGVGLYIILCYNKRS